MSTDETIDAMLTIKHLSLIELLARWPTNDNAEARQRVHYRLGVGTLKVDERGRLMLAQKVERIG